MSQTLPNGEGSGDNVFHESLVQRRLRNSLKAVEIAKQIIDLPPEEQQVVLRQVVYILGVELNDAQA